MAWPHGNAALRHRDAKEVLSKTASTAICIVWRLFLFCLIPVRESLQITSHLRKQHDG
eukprot:m.567238 g.567238  ORF g.567238 m.567238 type:complete len:58 (+) comp57836_c0_seq2:2461-2634(+)